MTIPNVGLKSGVSLLVLAGLALPAAARRDGHCTNAPRTEWQPMSVVEDKAKTMSYDVCRTKISGTCYEVHGRKNGVSFERYFNPATAEVAKIERD